MPNYVANFEGLFVGVLRKDSCKVITFAIITTAVVGCRVTVVIAVFMDSCGVLGVRFPLSDFAVSVRLIYTVYLSGELSSDF